MTGFPTNKISSFYTKEEVNCQFNQSIMSKVIPETSLARVLVITINNSHTNERLKCQFNRSIFGRYNLSLN